MILPKGGNLSADLLSRIEYFTEKHCQQHERLYRYGWGHLLFACYAAFPAHLTPDLLQKLRLNFRHYKDPLAVLREIHPVAVNDLLLSNLIRETGFERYEMPEAIRHYLLWLLQHSDFFEAKGISPLLPHGVYPSYASVAVAQINHLAAFLLRYVAEYYTATDVMTYSLREAQEWTAQAWLNPAQATHCILEKLYDESVADHERYHFSQLNNRLAAQYALHLNQAASDAPNSFSIVHTYTQGMTALYEGRQTQAHMHLSKFLRIRASEGEVDDNQNTRQLLVPEEVVKHLLKSQPNLTNTPSNPPSLNPSPPEAQLPSALPFEEDIIVKENPLNGDFFNDARQILTWELDGRATDQKPQTLSRKDFWNRMYLQRRHETSQFIQFLRAQEDLMLLNGNVGVGKSTYVRHKFEAERLCRGVIFDMVGRIREFISPESLHSDLRRVIQNGYQTALLTNYKAALLYREDYKDLTHEPDAEERRHGDWNSARTENICRTRLAFHALLLLQRDTKIWDYVTRNLGEIYAASDEEYEEEMRKRFMGNQNKYTQEVFQLLEWKHYVMLYHDLQQTNGLPHVLVFDNLDWLQLTVIQGAFINEALDIVRELRNEALGIKAIVCVRDENVAYFNHNGGASAKMFQIRFNREDYLVPGVINHFDLEAEGGDFTRQILQRRMDYAREKLAEAYPLKFALFNNIISNFWLLEDVVRTNLGYFRFDEFCNGSLRLMLELVYDCTFELISRLQRKGIQHLPGDQAGISLQTVRGSLICSLAYNHKTRDIIQTFYRSTLNELSDDYCCIYRLILVLLSNQKTQQPYTLGQMLQQLLDIFPMQTEAVIRRSLFDLYSCGVHHGELVVIYQTKVIRSPDDISPDAVLQITGRGRVFIRMIMINFDFFTGVIAQNEAKKPVHILYDMAPDEALKKGKSILKMVKDLAIRHEKFILQTIYPCLLSRRNGTKKPFEAYKKQGLSIGDNFHLERVCDNHKVMLKSYITDCLRGPKDTALLLSQSESDQLAEAIKYNWVEAHLESKGTYTDEQMAPLVERLPQEHPVRRLWNEVYQSYTPIKDGLTKIREMEWGVYD